MSVEQPAAAAITADPEPADQYSPAGRFIVAVAHNMLDLVVELFEPDFATAVVEPGSFYLFANSKFNTSSDPRTGQTGGVSHKRVRPGDTALAVAENNDCTEVAEFLRSHVFKKRPKNARKVAKAANSLS